MWGRRCSTRSARTRLHCRGRPRRRAPVGKGMSGVMRGDDEVGSAKAGVLGWLRVAKPLSESGCGQFVTSSRPEYAVDLLGNGCRDRGPQQWPTPQRANPGQRRSRRPAAMTPSFVAGSRSRLAESALASVDHGFGQRRSALVPVSEGRLVPPLVRQLRLRGRLGERRRAPEAECRPCNGSRSLPQLQRGIRLPAAASPGRHFR